MTWTLVNKPTVDNFTLQNFPGMEVYDDVSVTYDSSTTYYDGINYTAWTLPDNPSIAWNVANSSLAATKSVTAQTTRPEALFFKTDGLKMYISDGTLPILYEYALSTAWDVTTATFTQSSNLNAHVTYIDAMYFRSDGLKFYAADSLSNPRHLVEYDVSTAWDISTLVYVQNTNIQTNNSTPGGLYFSPDGLRAFITNYASSSISQYTLGTAWDVSTLTFKQNVSISNKASSSDGIYFKFDGTKLFVTDGNLPNSIIQYDVVVPWDIGTIVFVQKFVFSTSPDIDTFAVFFREDGYRYFLAVAVGATIRQYNLPESWTYVANPT